MPKVRLFLLLACLACALSTGAASGAPREVEVTATGLTRQDAITQGLVQALEQVSGVAIGSAQLARMELSSTATGDKQETTLTQQQQSATLKLTGGIISFYRVLDASDGVPVSIRLAVTIEVFEAKGLGNDSRRRIAVAFFAGSAGPSVQRLHERILTRLVQARRFAVVDRSENTLYTQEMALLRSGNAPLTEQARVGQVIGTDYVVTGKLRVIGGTQSSRVIGLTGEVVTTSTDGSADAEFQVIEIATRQIKWAGVVSFAGGDAVDRIGAQIADEITQTIYPMRLIKFDNPSALVVNQGGETLRAGQRFRALVLGEAMTDPYTHETLGQLEQQAGIIEITQVEAKMSYAQVISGQMPAPGSDVSIVLRPAPPAPVRTPARRQSSPPDAPAITKLPFDR